MKTMAKVSIVLFLVMSMGISGLSTVSADDRSPQAIDPYDAKFGYGGEDGISMLPKETSQTITKETVINSKTTDINNLSVDSTSTNTETEIKAQKQAKVAENHDLVVEKQATITDPAGVDVTTQNNHGFFYGEGSDQDNQYGPSSSTYYSKLRVQSDYENNGGLIRDFDMTQNAQFNLANGFGYVQNGYLPSMYHHTEASLNRNEYVYLYNEDDPSVDDQDAMYLYYWRIENVRYEIEILDENGDPQNIYDGNKFLVNLDKASILTLYKELQESQKYYGEEYVDWTYYDQTSSQTQSANTVYENLLLWAIEKGLSSKISYYSSVKDTILQLIEMTDVSNVQSIYDRTDLAQDPKKFVLEYDPRAESADLDLPYYVNLNLKILGDYISNNRLHEIRVNTIVDTILLTKRAIQEPTGTGSTSWYWKELDQYSYKSYQQLDGYQYIEPQPSNDIFVIQPYYGSGYTYNYVPNIQFRNVEDSSGPIDGFVTKLSDNVHKPLVIMFHDYASSARVTELSIHPPELTPKNWIDIKGDTIQSSSYLNIDSSTLVMSMESSANDIFPGATTYYPLIMELYHPPPSDPSISAPTSVDEDSSNTYYFSSSHVSVNSIYYEIDWNGDGTADEPLTGVSEEVAYTNHIYNTPGTETINARAKVAGSLWSQWSSTSVTVNDVDEPPTAPSISGPTSVNEDASNTWTFSASDPNSASISITIDWNGDGIADQTISGDTDTDLTASHTYPTPGTYDIKAKAKSADSVWSQTTTYSVTVNDVDLKPSVPTIGGATSVDEDTSNTWTFVASDSDSGTVTIEIKWGDDYYSSVSGGESNILSASHSYYKDGSFGIQARAKSASSGWTDWSSAYWVEVIPPDSAPNTPNKPTGSSSVLELESNAFGFYTTDPDSSSITFLIDWGDGSTSSVSATSGTTKYVYHTYATTGTKYIKVKAKSADSPWSNWSPSKSVTVDADDGGECISYCLMSVDDSSVVDLDKSPTVDQSEEINHGDNPLTVLIQAIRIVPLFMINQISKIN